MAEVTLGRIGMIARGVYSASETYQRLDTVAYNGAAWVALKNNLKGVTPSEVGDNWRLMVNSTGVTNVTINSSGHLIVTMTNGSTIDAGQAKGQDAPSITKKLITDTLGYTPADTAAVSTLAQSVSTNSSQIASVKSDIAGLPELTRQVNALLKLNQGVSYEFQYDTDPVSVKTVPSGAALASVNRIEGRTLTYNQMHANPAMTGSAKVSGGNVTITYSTAGAHVAYSGSNPSSIRYIAQELPSDTPLVSGNKYIMLIEYTASNSSTVLTPSMRGVSTQANIAFGTVFTANAANTSSRINISGWAAGDYIDISRWQLIDITDIFGTGTAADADINWLKTFAASHNTHEAGTELTAPVRAVSVNSTVYAIPAAIQQLAGYGSAGYYLYRTGSGTWTYHKADGTTQNVNSKMGTALDCLTVAKNNTVTLVNENGINVENTLEYVVKLSEVT